MAADPMVTEPVLTVSTRTWKRESHGLFDYESPEVVKDSFRMVSSFNVVRNHTEVLATTDRHEGEMLAHVVSKSGAFYIDRPVAEASPKYSKMWRVVGANQGGTKIKEGDLIKLARFKLRVRRLVADSEDTTTLSMSSSFTPKLCNAIAETPGDTCRICLMEGGEQDDPLIRPCECKGSIEMVHLECLRHWISGRLQVHNGEQAAQNSFFYRPLSCELCKSPYATHLVSVPESPSGQVEQRAIVELPKTRAPYIVLEKESRRAEEKGLYVVSLADKHRLKIGRGHESDARFADVSISRWHATIRFDPETKDFSMEDHESKFGTLVSVRTPILLNGCLKFQAGRTVMEFDSKNVNE